MRIPGSPDDARPVVAEPRLRVEGDGAWTVVLAHAPCGQAAEWDAVAARLLPTFRVVRMAYAGLGEDARTGWTPERYRTLHGHADDLVRALERLDWARIIVVGHGLAGHLALLARLAIPTRVAALVLVGTPPATVADAAGGDGMLSLSEAAALTSADDALARFCERAGALTVPSLVTRARDGTHDGEIAAITARALLTADVRRLLPRVTCPVAVLHGLWDPIVPVSAAHALVRALPTARLQVLATSSHALHREHPTVVTAAITELAGGD